MDVWRLYCLMRVSFDRMWSCESSGVGAGVISLAGSVVVCCAREYDGGDELALVVVTKSTDTEI